VVFPVVRRVGVQMGGGGSARDGTLVVTMRVFQQELVLDLQRDASFLGPSIDAVPVAAAVRTHDDVTPDDVTPEPLRRCFYSGHVNRDPDSYAALSVCGGLRGAFGHRGWEYFISPLLRNASGKSAPPHTVQRRATATHSHQRHLDANSTANSTSRCAVDTDVSPEAARSLDRYRRLLVQGRAKRFASVPRYVETLVVADESMVDFHGDDLKHYLLTLMSVAARLYKHPSIRNSISVVVVKFVMISEADKGPKVSGNAAMTLRNFCTWQKKMNKNNDKHADYWDTAILFTRQVMLLYWDTAILFTRQVMVFTTVHQTGNVMVLGYSHTVHQTGNVIILGYSHTVHHAGNVINHSPDR